MSDKRRYDVIVIGGGHNGLTTAGLLARRGRKVLVLEQMPHCGGLGASVEFAPGYRSAGVLHDTTGVRQEVIDALNLKRYGLELEGNPPSVFTPESRGKGLLLYHDPQKAAGEIARFSERDAESYIAYREFIGRVRGFINDLLDTPPPDFDSAKTPSPWEITRRAMGLRRLGKRDMMEVLRVVPMSVADWLDEWFESDLLKASLAGPAVYGTFMGPRSPGSAVNLLLWECRKRPSIKGGPAFLVTALEGAARANGVDIETGKRVKAIRVADGRVEGITATDGEAVAAPIVAATCDPKKTILELLAAGTAPARLEQRMARFRARGTTAKVDLALNARVELAGRPGERVEYVRTGENLDELERAFDAVKYNEYSEEPILDIYMPTFSNPGFAPEGHSVLSVLVHFAPYELATKWDDESREDLGEKVVDVLSRYAPGIADVIDATSVLSPADLESVYGTTQGHIYHGEHALDQLILRPTPETARYATPVKGLYLCGSGSHPGGGITCAPGLLGAKAVLKG